MPLTALQDNAPKISTRLDAIKVVKAGMRAVEIYGVFAVEDSGILSSKKKKSAQPQGARLCIEKLAEQFYNGSEGASGVFVQSYLNSGDCDPRP